MAPSSRAAERMRRTQLQPHVKEVQKTQRNSESNQRFPNPRAPQRLLFGLPSGKGREKPKAARLRGARGEQPRSRGSGEGGARPGVCSSLRSQARGSSAHFPARKANLRW
ncbi:hypothetical protein OJAV_G00039490 [Oryzias javanicus]|uniref:Uncharacterized protein n=1 Tax=Oryzias javanicus TaxID=123683 RepID=A0A3S2PD86_ORYJA|nr:hypothetical protein OJAV_G00039490 [Oryzias javanicus]